MKKMNKKGFTLVEIMIVVAIIGLLAAIGIPSFQKARENSLAKTKVNNVRIVNAAVSQYAMEQGLTTGATVAPANYTNYVENADLDVGATTFKNPTATVGTALTEANCY